jgi:hypothetical protein
VFTSTKRAVTTLLFVAGVFVLGLVTASLMFNSSHTGGAARTLSAVSCPTVAPGVSAAGPGTGPKAPAPVVMAKVSTRSPVKVTVATAPARSTAPAGGIAPDQGKLLSTRTVLPAVTDPPITVPPITVPPLTAPSVAGPPTTVPPTVTAPQPPVSGGGSEINVNVPVLSSGSTSDTGSLVNANVPVASSGSSSGVGSLVDADVPVASKGSDTTTVNAGGPVAASTPTTPATPTAPSGTDSLVNVNAPIASSRGPAQAGVPVTVAAPSSSGRLVHVNAPVADGNGTAGHGSLINVNAPLAGSAS